jgi:hypothetical protein
MRRHLSLFVTVGLLMLSAWLAFSVFHGYQEGKDKAHRENCEILARHLVYSSDCP